MPTVELGSVLPAAVRSANDAMKHIPAMNDALVHTVQNELVSHGNARDVL